MSLNDVEKGNETDRFIWSNPTALICENGFSETITDLCFVVKSEREYEKLTHLLRKGLIYNVLVSCKTKDEDGNDKHLTENFYPNQITPVYDPMEFI